VEDILVLFLDPLGKILDAQFLSDQILVFSDSMVKFDLHLRIFLPGDRLAKAPSLVFDSIVLEGPNRRFHRGVCWGIW
jgi:hypothetical protein